MKQPFKIVKRDSFRVIGYKIETANQRSQRRKAIPAFWEKFTQQNKVRELTPFMNQEPRGILGINVYNVDDSDSRKFDYFISAASNLSAPDTMISYTVQAATWAVFPCTKETIAKTEVMAITKWLPKFKYKPLNSGYITGRMKSHAPDIECYGENGEIEVWIAIKEQ